MSGSVAFWKAVADDHRAAFVEAEVENERLREALTLIHDGLTSSLGHGLGVSPAMALGLESIARHALRVPEEVR